MLDTLSIRGRFIIAAMIYGMIAILISMFLPFVYTETVHFNRENIVTIIPLINFKLLGLSQLIIVLTLVFLGFKRNYLSYFIAFLLLVSALIMGYFSLLSVTLIQEHKIIYKNFKEERVYEWSEIDTLVYEYAEYERGNYIFTTKKNESFTIQETSSFGLDEKRAIYQIINENDIEFIEKAKSE
ncbi:hypothetical protein MHH85_04855 [Viridibacillus sp. FSL E2-0187]|uniref:hypothetical protein n=1 Tax=Viridibacillus TaxID=496496 RepID=UPI0030F98189